MYNGPNSNTSAFSKLHLRETQKIDLNIHDCALGISPVTFYSGVKMLVLNTEKFSLMWAPLGRGAHRLRRQSRGGGG